MKKKLALLLVLSMVLSMIPMNVFGANEWTRVGRTVYVTTTATEASNTIVIDAFWLTTGSSIELASTSDDTSWKSVTVSGGYQVEAYTDGDTEVLITRTTATRPISINQSYITVTAEMNLDGDHDDAAEFEADVTMVDEDTRITQTETLVFAKVREVGLSISAGDLVEFTDSVEIEDLTIKENTIGHLAGTGSTNSKTWEFLFVIDTTGFEWSGKAPTLDANRQLTTPQDHKLTATEYRYGTYGKSEKPAVAIRVTAGKTSLTQSGLAEIAIQDLGIMPTDKAKYGKVKVVPYPIDGTFPSTGFNLVGTELTATDLGDAYDTITVAEYVDYGLVLEYDEDEDIDDFDVISGKLDQETVAFHLTEVSPYSWGASRASETRFTVPDGVLITGADVNLYGSYEDSDIIDEESYNTVDAANSRDSYGVLLKSNYLSVAPYIQTNSVLENGTYDLYVKLYLSVEPGYVAKYGTDEIAVEVSGPAVANKTIQNGNSIVIANVYDPIEVETNPVNITTDASGYYPANEIVINELYGGALENGTEVWVYLDSEYYNTFEIPTTGVKASGLSIGRAVKTSRGIKFEITRESDDDKPGSITINGAALAGFAFYGLNYNIVVAGNAVAENDYDVYDAAETDADDRSDLFEDSYYTSPIFTFEGSTVSNNNNTNPAGTTPGQATAAESLWNGKIATLSNGNTVEVYKNRSTTGNLVVGYVSARYFADWLGTDIDWDDSTGVATISYNGTTVTLQTGNTNMNVNGADVDIADYAQQSGPTGTITIVNDNSALYLPLRALCNAFGINISWNASTSTVTIQ